MIEILLPPPPSKMATNRLKPMTRGGAYERRQIVRRWKNAAQKCALAAIGRKDAPMIKAAHAFVTFHFKQRRRRDPDNFLACLKPVWDGFVSAGVMEDDEQLIVWPPCFVAPSINSQVIIDIYDHFSDEWETRLAGLVAGIKQRA